MKDDDLDKLLDQYRLGDGQYSIGPFLPGGVTLWKQQVRALNLIYALALKRQICNRYDQDKKKGAPCHIAVLGAGVAGMTAAVAAVELGNLVCHFEQRPVLCHLQAGCDTRWLHPNIYDWPIDRSDNPYAALPCLTWQAGTAAEVARLLQDQYKNVRDRDETALECHLGATTFLDGRTVKWDNSKGPTRGGTRTFDLVIVATGFGIEVGVERGDVDSYWRNDDLNQLQPGITSEKSDRILVSGTGDGGLIDLLRSKLNGFNQAWIIGELFSASDELTDRLEATAIDWRTNPQRSDKSWLFREFDRLYKEKAEAVKELVSRLKDRVREDAVAILNGRQDVFSEVLNLDTGSLLNCFLVYLLYHEKYFNYVPGDCKRGENENEVIVTYPCADPKDASKTPVRSSRYVVDQAIFRHGTNRVQCLQSLGISSDAIAALKDRQEAKGIDTFEPKWTDDGWFAQRAPNGRKEFLPPPSQAIAATFVRTLGKMIELDGGIEDFRVTVHRTIDIHGKKFFQQMAPYGGTRKSSDPKRDPARVFKLEVGLVGLACRNGKSALLLRDGQWDQIWNDLEARRGSHITTYPDKVEAMLVLPIFFKTSKSASPADLKKVVSLVLYFDSKDTIDPSSKKAKKLLRIVYNGAKEFVKNFDDLVERRVVRLARDSFVGAELQSLAKDKTLEDKNSSRLIVDPDELPSDLVAAHCLNWDCVAETGESP